MEDSFKYLVAKLDADNKKWLPLWIHCADTYNVMRYLLSQWLNDGMLYAVTKTVDADQIKKIVLFLAAFHDYGKSSITFQAKIVNGIDELYKLHDEAGLFTPSESDPDIRNGKEMPHGVAGEIMLLIKGCSASLAAIIGAHHGRPWEKGLKVAEDIEDILEEDEDDIYLNFSYGLRLWGGKKRRKKWIKTQDAFYEWALHEAGISNIKDLPDISDSEAVVLSGLVIMADWLASNEEYFPLISYDQLIPEDIDKRSYRAVKRINLPPAWRPVFRNDFRKLSIERFGFLPNEIQSSVVNSVINSKEPGLFILEAPMGVGKTEAALLASEEFSQERVAGMLFALPTQATANGIFSRIIEWGKSQTSHNRASIRLAHGMAALNDEYSFLIDKSKHLECAVDDYENNGLIVHDFFQGPKQALLADFVVGTIDQVLLASLKQRHFMLRHLGLCGKVVIIDECHAYDTYMNEYLERTLQWLGAYRAPVIMLSATLPYERRSALVDAYLGIRKHEEDETWRKSMSYPLLTWTDGSKVMQKELEYSGQTRQVQIIKVKCTDGGSAEIASIIKILTEELENGGCAGVVVNTVKRAQDIASAARKAIPGKNVLLLHSRFISEDRLEYESELLHRAGKHSTEDDRNGLIVIGTQVIEQSLDFDVDVMISDLCPMDLLLQRIGRLHRHSVHDGLRPQRLKKAKCYVLGTDKIPEKGSAAVYGEYLLMRTNYFLPEKIALPKDIAVLVQSVYDDNNSLTIKPVGYDKACSEHREKQIKARKDADAFRLLPPGKERTINKFLEAAALADEEQAKAQVRNGDTSLEVIVMFILKDGISRAPWRYKDQYVFDRCPSESASRAISNQRLRFPPWMSGIIPHEELSLPSEWKKSVWLRNQHLLLLDKNGKKEFGDYVITYSPNYGLTIERRNKT